ncbi:family 2 glycosyl transferase [Nocardiopsis sp. FR4]|uniref:family 2 glycosyl transferase n=1 Tax=Nocardiopsis sp. FR4 TaxID=2605985 RepID=UPI001F1D907A|nr:family 2 glycosyl transferase [Nocardiopsis sp. FR4]
MASRPPAPPGPGIEIDRSVRLADEGHVLLGGCPPRAVRLSPRRVSALIRWLSGSAPRGAEEERFARALVRAGLAHPRPAPLPPGEDVAVAVVGRAGPGALAATLDRLAELHPRLRPVVVGAEGAEAWQARRRGARVVPSPSGGARARAAALRACRTEVVALLEAGTRPAAGWLDTALGHFADPGVAAVVPRVLADRSRCLGHLEMTVAAVAASRAGPDLGADPAPLLPWGHAGPRQQRPGAVNEPADPLRPVPCLVVRRSVADLDPGLGAAAELDLLWRLAEQDWSVRYEPRARVWAPPTTRLGAYLRDCFVSGSCAGPLAAARDGRAAGPELPLAGAAGLVLAAFGRPGAALAAGVLGGAAVTAALAAGGRTPLPDAVRLAGADLAYTARTATRAIRASWWPVAAAAAAGGAAAWRRGDGTARAGRLALAAGAALALPHLAAWRRGRGAALTGPLAWTALGMAGDAARSLGTWWGMARARSAAPLVPRIRPTAAFGAAPSVPRRDLLRPFPVRPGAPPGPRARGPEPAGPG